MIPRHSVFWAWQDRFFCWSPSDGSLCRTRCTSWATASFPQDVSNFRGVSSRSRCMQQGRPSTGTPRWRGAPALAARMVLEELARLHRRAFRAKPNDGGRVGHVGSPQTSSGEEGAGRSGRRESSGDEPEVAAVGGSSARGQASLTPRQRNRRVGIGGGRRGGGGRKLGVVPLDVSGGAFVGDTKNRSGETCRRRPRQGFGFGRQGLHEINRWDGTRTASLRQRLP